MPPMISSPRRPLAPGASHTPGWWRNAVIYQVYVRSFHDANGDGIGDLDGVRAKLPYLRMLGVDGVWLNPFFPSPKHDHGYDVADYMAVDPDCGTFESFDRLLADAHRWNIKVIIDVIPNHCSVEHPWFRAALAAPPGSPERARFHFADGRGANGELPPNNWRSIFGGSAWRRTTNPDGTPGQWYLHTFSPEQPDFNWRHPDVVKHFDDVVRFWFDRGVDGLRIDVAHGLFKRDGLPDHEYASHDELTGDPINPYAWNQPEVHDVWRRWRAIADTYGRDGQERVLIGEVGILDPAQLAEYQRPDELHQAFYFAFLRAAWNDADLCHVIENGLGTIAASGSAVTWVLNNHDMPRSVTRYAGGAPGGGPGDLALGQARARAAALLMLALPGSAYLYQGEELGLPEVVDLPDHVRSDPMYRRSCGVRQGRDGCRVPLPWAASERGTLGFSAVGSQATPWLPQPAWFAELAVDQQLRDRNSMLQLYRHAITLRHQIPALATDKLRWLRSEPGTLAFTRGDGFACIVNCSDRPVRAPEGRLLLGSDQNVGEKLPPNTAGWWILSGE